MSFYFAQADMSTEKDTLSGYVCAESQPNSKISFCIIDARGGITKTNTLPSEYVYSGHRPKTINGDLIGVPMKAVHKKMNSLCFIVKKINYSFFTVIRSLYLT